MQTQKNNNWVLLMFIFGLQCKAHQLAYGICDDFIPVSDDALSVVLDQVLHAITTLKLNEQTHEMYKDTLVKCRSSKMIVGSVITAIPPKHFSCLIFPWLPS